MLAGISVRVYSEFGYTKSYIFYFFDMTQRSRNSYWQKNLFWIRTLLILWSVLVLGCGVLWVRPLNKLHIGELPLGFWVAQQGAVIGFVALVFVYAIGMNHLDNQHAKNESK